MTVVLYALGGYLLGSIPFAVVVSRAMGLKDPRSYGSKNPGATNVLRSGNRIAALLTMVGDAAKGWAAVLIAALSGADALSIAVVAIAALLGHVFPVWLRFHGGKGVATAAGVLIAIDWRLGLVVIATWLAVVVASRYSSLAALCASIVAPAMAWFVPGSPPLFAAVLAMSAILVWRHQANIVKLMRGEESRIGEKKAEASAPPQAP